MQNGESNSKNGAIWDLIKMNPPTLDQAYDLSKFIKNQTNGDHHVIDKDLILRWKLCNYELKTGFACAMAIHGSKQIISTITITPKRLWRNGMEQFWGEVGDAFTDPNYQRKGMFTTLVNANTAIAQSEGVEIIYSLPDDKSQSKKPFLNKCEFLVKEDLKFSNYFTFLSTNVLAARGPFSRITLLKRLFSSSIVTRASRLFFCWALTLTIPKNSQISVDIESDFGAEFDALWQRARISLPNAQVRDSRYLKWRYCQNPLPFKVLVARFEGEVVGYASTLTIRHMGANAFSHTILLDWLYDKSCGKEINSALLSAAMNLAIAEKADVLSAVASTANILKLPFTRLGFLRINREMSMVVHRNQAGQALLEDSTPWHFTLSDTDAF